MRQEQPSLTKQEKRKAMLIAWIIVLALIGGTALALWLKNGNVLPQKITVADESETVKEAAATLDTISVSMTFDPEKEKQVTATQELTLTNRTGQDQRTAVLRSWTGAYLSEETSPVATSDSYDDCYPDGFSAGGAEIELVSVNGEQVTASWSDTARTVLSITLNQPWKSGESITVKLAWRAAVPDCASRFGARNGTYMLGSLIPVPAVWDGSGWADDAYAAVGDPFQYAECANWQVDLTVPEGYTAASTGWCDPVAENGRRVYHWQADAVRDFTVCISNAWRLAQGMEGGVMIAAYAQDSSRAERMVKYARQAVRLYASLWGEYPYPVLTLCEADFPYSGMEYSRLILMGTNTVNGADDDLEWGVAHETAHQWWGIAVGSDAVRQAWQDETLCTYAMLRYVARYVSDAAANTAANTLVSAGEDESYDSGLTPGCPLSWFSSMEEYTRVVYYRGAALWLSLERLEGQTALDAALKDYAEAWRFRIAERDDLTALLTEHFGAVAEGLMEDVLDTVNN